MLYCYRLMSRYWGISGQKAYNLVEDRKHVGNMK